MTAVGDQVKEYEAVLTIDTDKVRWTLSVAVSSAVPYFLTLAFSFNRPVCL